jgi:hypothetical protein
MSVNVVPGRVRQHFQSEILRQFDDPRDRGGYLSGLSWHPSRQNQDTILCHTFPWVEVSKKDIAELGSNYVS